MAWRGRPPRSTTSPASDASDAHWVTPRLVGEVTFGEWTGSGKLRHPVWRGWRLDKDADEVVAEAYGCAGGTQSPGHEKPWRHPNTGVARLLRVVRSDARPVSPGFQDECGICGRPVRCTAVTAASWPAGRGEPRSLGCRRLPFPSGHCCSPAMAVVTAMVAGSGMDGAVHGCREMTPRPPVRSWSQYVFQPFFLPFRNEMKCLPSSEMSVQLSGRPAAMLRVTSGLSSRPAPACRLHAWACGSCQRSAARVAAPGLAGEHGPLRFGEPGSDALGFWFSAGGVGLAGSVLFSHLMEPF